MKRATVYRLDTFVPFIEDAQIITNTDGSVSFLLPDGSYAGQEPGVYGMRHDQDPGTGNPQSYQRATLSGGLVTFCTLPQFPIATYMIGIGQQY